MKVRCAECSTPFEAQRATAKFCSGTCRQRNYQAAKIANSPAETPKIAPLTPTLVPNPLEHPLITATRRELADADRLDSVAGQLALELAEKVCSGRDTGSAKAAASKEFRSVLAEALATAPRADVLDELAARRLGKASGA